MTKFLTFFAIWTIMFSTLQAPVHAIAGQWSKNGSNIYYNDGKIGIGTSAPSWKFQVNTAGNAGGFLINGDGNVQAPTSRIFQISNGVNRAIVFLANGNVGIGTIKPSRLLSVNGTILAKEVIVSTQASNWPDYVFADDYELMELDEIQAYVDANNHLPGVPSATQLEKEGVSLLEMQKLQMEKIEELTLHLIEKDEEIEALEERLDRLEYLLSLK